MAASRIKFRQGVKFQRGNLNHFSDVVVTTTAEPGLGNSIVEDSGVIDSLGIGELSP